MDHDDLSIKRTLAPSTVHNNRMDSSVACAASAGVSAAAAAVYKAGLSGESMEPRSYAVHDSRPVLRIRIQSRIASDYHETDDGSQLTHSSLSAH